MPNGIPVDLGAFAGQPTPKKQKGGGGSFLGNALGDVGHALHWTEHEVGRTVKNVEDMAINSIPGAVDLIGGLATNPLETLKEQGVGAYHTLEHPLRDPGYTAATLLMLEGAAGGIAGRAGAAAGIADRSGGLAPDLTESIAKVQAASPTLTSYEIAGKLGRQAEYTRAIRQGRDESGNITETPKSTSEQLLRSLVFGPAREQRPLTDSGASVLDTLLSNPAGNITYGWQYSKDPFIKAAQKQIDQMHIRFPDSTTAPIWKVINPTLWRSQASRMSSASKAMTVITANTERQAGAAFARKWAKESDVTHIAARMVAEGTTTKDLLDMHQRVLDSGALNGKPKLIAETEARMPLIQQAGELLDEKTHELPSGRTETVPVPKPEQELLRKYVTEARAISEKRTAAARLTGILSEESHYGRAVGPLNFARYGEVPEKLSRLVKMRTIRETNLGRADLSDAARDRTHHQMERIDKALRRIQGKLTPEEIAGMPHGEKLPITEADAEALVKQAGLFYVPYEIDRPSLKSFASTAFRKATKFSPKNPPSTFTHHFEAKILEKGGGRNNIAKLLAESYTEAHRYIAFKHNRDRILKGGRLTPESIPPKWRVLMRTNDRLPAGAIPYGRAENLAYSEIPDSEIMQRAFEYEGVRDFTFPNMVKALKAAGSFTDKQIHNFLHGTEGKFQKVPGYVWVDGRTLGGLDKPNPLFGMLGHPVVRGAIHLFDAVNNAQKIAILYLKPAYAIPNLLGNVALNLVQQGFLAPVNLSKSVFSYRVLDKDTNDGIRGIMGEGFSESISPSGFSGHITHAGNWLAAKYGKLIDDPLRFAAFLHEARVDGFVSREELHSLVTDEHYREQFQNIGNRANDAIIQYERLGPGEQAVLRRLIFFYPWVKGSTRYALQLPKEQPFTAGLIGQSGQHGTEVEDKIFGGLPAYAEGLIAYKKPNKQGIAQVGNPASFAILQQPAEVLKALAATVEGHPNQDLSILGNLAPGDAALLTLASLGKFSSVPHPASWSPIHAALQEAFGGNPIKQLYENTTGGPARPNSLYPDNSLYHAFLRYFVGGGLIPRAYNVPKGNAVNWRENHPVGFTG